MNQGLINTSLRPDRFFPVYSEWRWPNCGLLNRKYLFPHRPSPNASWNPLCMCARDPVIDQPITINLKLSMSRHMARSIRFRALRSALKLHATTTILNLCSSVLHELPPHWFYYRDHPSRNNPHRRYHVYQGIVFTDRSIPICIPQP